MTLNCIICGTPLYLLKAGGWFCPNHGTIVENQNMEPEIDFKEEEKEND